VDIALWDNKRKVQELASVLRGKAQSWWDSLAAFQVNKIIGLPSGPAFSSHLTPKHCQEDFLQLSGPCTSVRRKHLQLLLLKISKT
jgi:hypothetical protein